MAETEQQAFERRGGDHGSRPVPDPTLLTTAQLVRAVQAERDYVDGRISVLEERLRGIDTATQLLNDTVNRVPTEVQKEVAHLTSVIDERFRAVALQFGERDTRAERESKDNQIRVDAAFAAQKESAAEQNRSNTLAINKSEAATQDTIVKLERLFDSTNKGLTDKIDDIKGRVQSMESLRNGALDQRTDTRATIGTTGTVIAAVVGLIAILAVIVTLYSGSHSTPTTKCYDANQTRIACP